MKITVFEADIPENAMKELAQNSHGDMVKGVVDLETRWVALGGELHADAEERLLHKGSKQSNLWGFNLYPDKKGNDRIQYTSFINIRPRDGNKDIEVKDARIQSKMQSIIFQKLGWTAP